MRPGGPTLAEAGGESAVILAILGQSRLRPASLLVGPGDDAAVLEMGQRIVVTTDLLAQGTHFRLDWMSAREAGWRAAVASLSDAAAMGASPTAGFLSVGAPGEFSFEQVVEAGKGVVEGLEAYGACIAGGDVVRADQLLLNVTLLAEVGDRWLERNGVRPGDAICVTGRLGGSWAAVRLLSSTGVGPAEAEHSTLLRCYRRPYARVEAGKWLALQSEVHAMMDISDGLGSDLPRMAGASGVGAELWAAKLPLRPGLEDAAEAVGVAAWEIAAAGGEDFELLFAVDGEAAGGVLDGLQAETGLQATVVGAFTASGKLTMLDGRGRKLATPASFSHFGEGTQ